MTSSVFITLDPVPQGKGVTVLRDLMWIEQGVLGSTEIY